MPDTTLAAGIASASSPVEAELIANNSGLLWPSKGTLAAGQNLRRGALLGRIGATSVYTLSLAANSDGSQVPVAVLVHDTNAAGGEVEALVYRRGDFNQAAMTFGAGHTPGSVAGALRDAGIFIHKPYGVASDAFAAPPPAPAPAPAPSPAPAPAPAPADTRPRFGYAPANAAGDQAAFATLFSSMTPLTGSANAGRAGTFSTASSTTNYTWIAVLHSAAPNGIRVYDGTGYGGFSGATATGIYQGADTDPLTLHGTYTDGSGNVWDMYRSNGKASTFSTFTLS